MLNMYVTAITRTNALHLTFANSPLSCNLEPVMRITYRITVAPSVDYPIVHLWENLPPNLDRTTQPN